MMFHLLLLEGAFPPETCVATLNDAAVSDFYSLCDMRLLSLAGFL